MNDLLKSLKTVLIGLGALAVLILVLMLGLLFWNQNPSNFDLISQEEEQVVPGPVSVDEEGVEDGIHVPTGLVADEGYQMVIANCTPCHSANLVTQNRGNKEYWKGLIVWMQTTQGLWDLGENEDKILAYLEKNYAPTEMGRRANLTGIKWYVLEE